MIKVQFKTAVVYTSLEKVVVLTFRICLLFPLNRLGGLEIRLGSSGKQLFCIFTSDYFQDLTYFLLIVEVLFLTFCSVQYSLPVNVWHCFLFVEDFFLSKYDDLLFGPWSSQIQFGANLFRLSQNVPKKNKSLKVGEGPGSRQNSA